MTALLPTNESQRLDALRALAILDTHAEPRFDDITRLAAQICATPIALVSLIDEKRQWFKSKVGLGFDETPRDVAFCAHALDGRVLVVPDALQDPRFADNPLVTGDEAIRFYAGVPLIASGGFTLGTLCVIDLTPRTLDESQLSALQVLSRQVMDQIQSRYELGELRKSEAALLGMLADREVNDRELRHLAENLTVAQAVGKLGSWETEGSTLHVTWSAQTHRIFETDIEVFIPTHADFMEFVHPDDRQALNSSFMDSFSHLAPCLQQHRIVMPDGRVKFIEERWQAFESECDRPVYAIGTCQDITERKHAEEERDRLFNLSLDMLCVANFDGRFLQVNPAWTQCLGWTAEELIGGVMADFIHPEDHEGSVKIRESIKAGNPARGFENRYRCRDGSYRWFSWNVHPLTGARQVFAVARDITERKQAEHDLRASEAAQRLAAETQMAVQDAIPAHIALIDRHGCIISVNESWRRFATANSLQSTDFFVGDNYLRVCDSATGEGEEDARQVAAGLRGVLDGARSAFEYEYPCHSPTKERWFRIVATPLRKDRQAGAVVMHINITDRKKSEEKLSRINRLYQVLSRTNEMIVRVTTHQELIEGACRIAVEQGLFRAAAVFVTDPDGETVQLSAHAGGDKRFFSDAVIHVTQGQTSRGTIGTAIRSGFHNICNDLANDPRMVAWKIAALEHGYLSVAAFPLRKEGKTYGALGLFAAEPDCFQTAEIELLDSVAENLSFALEFLDKEQRRLVAETALRASETTMATAQLIGQFGSWEMELTNPDISTNPVRWSDGMFRVAGFEPGAVAATNELFFRLVHPDDRESIGLAVAEAIREHHQYSIVHRLIRPDGEERIIQETARIFFDEQTGEPLHVIGNAHDITEQRQAEATLRESELRFRELAENINEVFWITNPNTRELLYVNPSYERIWGFTCESLYQSPRSWLESIHPDDRERAYHASSDSPHGAYDEIYRIVRADGEIRWIHDRAYPVRNEAGEVYRMVGTAQDITERKIMEQQFLRAQRMDGIGALASGIAHDLNNVLAPILMSVELLESQLVEPRALAILEMIGSSARRGADMVTQVLSFARGTETGRSRLLITSVVSDLIKVIRETFPKNIRITATPEQNIWPVDADPTQLHQVLLNLCVNARDAMPDGGTIHIGLSNTTTAGNDATLIPGARAGRHVRIDVEDTGTGMPQELVDRIFDPFFTTKEVGKGTGLGLSSVQAIVTGHDGFIEVSSEPGKGSRFRVYFPASLESPAEPMPEDHLAYLRGHGETVLVVDDEASICEIANQTLEAFGYNVLVAGDGSEALALFAARQGRIDFVVTDMTMPVMNGPTLIRELKKLEPGVRIIGTSGVVGSSLVAESRKEGMLTFLPKPYTAPALLKALQDVLTTGTPVAPRQ